MVLTDDIHELPPGTWYTQKGGFKMAIQIKTGQLPHDNIDIISTELRQRLENAVARRMVSEETGVWLYGGLDSSIIASLMRRHVKKLYSFVSGVEGAPDIEYSHQMAEFLGTEHKVVTVVLDDLMAALPEVIYHLESFDALLVRSSIVNYLTAKMASDYVQDICSGEGADELFAGYDYIKQMPTEQISDELDDIVRRLHDTAFQRVDRCAYAHSIVPFVPFSDR